jgi:SH3 domain protein
MMLHNADSTRTTAHSEGVHVKTIISVFLILATFSAQAEETVYVTDEVKLQIRSGQGTKFRILTSAKTGASLTLLETDDASGWSRVRTQKGSTGWVLSRLLTSTPVARLQLAATTSKLASVATEITALKKVLKNLQSDHQEMASEAEALKTEKSRLIQELTSIRQASSKAIEIQKERNQLQERIINLERDMQTVSHEKQTLEESTSQDWFLIGAGVLLGGIILGLILPRISWRRKTSSWDSF